MEFTGRFKEINRNWETDEYQITFTINESASVGEVDKIKDCEKLCIKATKYRKKRSRDANALLWKCLGEMAEVLHTDKWEVYLQMLKQYGKYTYICVRPGMVQAVKEQWRESEVVGEIDINGQPSVQMLCYFGSSTYDTKEFSTLLEGVIYEMKELEIQPPTSKEMKRSLELWGEKYEETH